MVANCASSRRHIELTGAPCGDVPGFIWALASALNAPTPSSAVQAKIQQEKGVINVLGMSDHQGDDSAQTWKSKARPIRFHIPASRGNVTSFPGHWCGVAIRPRHISLAFAGNCDIFIAAGVVAFRACFWKCTGNFIRVDTPICCGLEEIMRLAIGFGGIGAAFLALGKALVDAVAVRLVSNNEHTTVGRRGRCGEQECTCQDCEYRLHTTPRE